jgi:hypothetical protein
MRVRSARARCVRPNERVGLVVAGSVVIAVVLLYVTAAEKAVVGARWLKRRFRPEPPEPPTPPPVYISEQISRGLSYAQDEGAPHRRLS